MNAKQAPPPSPGITPGDVYYILFRHKWLIAILSAVTIAATLIATALSPVPYQSEAMLMIKYVHDNKLEQMTTASAPSDARGETVINSEIKILTSYDLALDVVDTLGPAPILAKAGGGSNRIAAANVIKNGIQAVADKSDVVELVFAHPDPEMVQPILGQLIKAYLKKHYDIHQPALNDSLQKYKDDALRQINEIDRDLKDLRDKADYTYGATEESYSSLQSEILSQELKAEADYVALTATVQELRKSLPTAQATNTAASSNVDNNVAIPPAKSAEYQRLCDQLGNLQSQEQDLLLRYTTNNTLVQTKMAEVARAEAVKKQLEDKYPGLIAIKPAEAKSGPTVDPRAILKQEEMRALILAQRIQALTNQLAQVRSNSANMNSYADQISLKLQQKEIAEEQFKFYSQKTEDSRVNEMIGPGTSNISEVEAPMPPSRNVRKITKLIGGILAGGLIFAFGLPFVIEFYLDRTLKRPLDVQSRLGLPFFISIPLMNGNGKSRALKKAKKVDLLPAPAQGAAPPGAEPQPAPAANGHLALWEMNHSLQPFYETLRDRLMSYFEMINLTHKPKLVAVTSCGAGAGVTSTAAGLASSLSETGDGNVLLVNMNVVDGEAHHFYKGKLACGLDEVLEKGTRGNAFVQGHLYVAKEQPEDDRLPRVLPKRFNHLLPKMKASDFDYIIFDMPPVSQISVTSRLARFMDMVLLVIESEKTDRDVASRAANLLAETKTNVGVVLNKNRSYGPRKNQHDI